MARIAFIMPGVLPGVSFAVTARPGPPPLILRTGLYLALVQLLFTATWTIYVAFLPQLAAAAGIPKERVVWILMLDQVIFIAMDFALGVAADRVAAAMRRLSGPMVAVTALSCAAFLLLPHAGASPALLLALTAIWAITSSALRAPPMAMFARHVSAAATPRFVFLSLLGIGLASAIAPWLTARLRGVSPELPFALAAVGLLAAVAAMGWCERRLASGADDGSAKDAAAAAGARPATPAAPRHVLAFFVCVVLLGLGFQIHTALNSAPAYLRFAKAPDLEWMMGLFWIGFSICIMLRGIGSLKTASPARMLMAGTAAGALALAVVASATSLALLICAQLVAGGAWGLIIGYALSAAIDAGRTGREGRFTGLIFALLAAAALTRFAIVVSGVNKAPEWSVWFTWLPALAWSAALVLLALAVLRGTFSR